MRLVPVTALLMASLVWASSAVAQGPTEDGYGGVAGNVQAQTGSGTLPFTGQDLRIFVLAGLLLIATGVALRRFARSKNPS